MAPAGRLLAVAALSFLCECLPPRDLPLPQLLILSLSCSYFPFFPRCEFQQLLYGPWIPSRSRMTFRSLRCALLVLIYQQGQGSCLLNLLLTACAWQRKSSQFFLPARKPADLCSSIDNVQVCRGCGAIQAAHLLRASRRFTGSFAHRQMTAAASCRSSRPAASCPCRTSHPAAPRGHLFPSWRPLHSRRSLTTARQSSQVALSVTNLLFLSFRASLLWLGELKS